MGRGSGDAPGPLLQGDIADPTVGHLHTQGHEMLHDVLAMATFREDERMLAEIVDWAAGYLHLEAAPEVREATKARLLSESMPGICAGGYAGMTDANLNSVYGQVLLQTLLALDGYRPMGEPLIVAALQTDYPHLPGLAGKLVDGWPAEAVSPDLRALAETASTAH